VAEVAADALQVKACDDDTDDGKKCGLSGPAAKATRSPRSRTTAGSNCDRLIFSSCFPIERPSAGHTDVIAAHRCAAFNHGGRPRLTFSGTPPSVSVCPHMTWVSHWRHGVDAAVA